MLDKLKCSCGKYLGDGLPCQHVTVGKGFWGFASESVARVELGTVCYNRSLICILICILCLTNPVSMSHSASTSQSYVYRYKLAFLYFEASAFPWSGRVSYYVFAVSPMMLCGIFSTEPVLLSLHH